MGYCKRVRVSDRDLRILDNPTADNLNPQETTSQDSIDMGQDGDGLSCPSSSVIDSNTCKELTFNSFLGILSQELVSI